MNTKNKLNKPYKEVFKKDLSLADILRSTRLCNEETQTIFSKKLGISVKHLSDIENGRKAISPERAALFARKLGHLEEFFVLTAINDYLRNKKINITVSSDRKAG